MSYKRQLEAHYRNLIHSILTISAPEWLTGRGMRASLVLVVMVMSAGYILQVNSVATSGYEAHALENQIAELNNEVRNLEIKIADAGSMNNIQKRLQGTNLIAVEDFQRYNNSGALVAVAR